MCSPHSMIPIMTCQMSLAVARIISGNNQFTTLQTIRQDTCRISQSSTDHIHHNPHQMNETERQSNILRAQDQECLTESGQGRTAPISTIYQYLNPSCLKLVVWMGKPLMASGRSRLGSLTHTIRMTTAIKAGIIANQNTRRYHMPAKASVRLSGIFGVRARLFFYPLSF